MHYSKHILTLGATVAVSLAGAADGKDTPNGDSAFLSRQWQFTRSVSPENLIQMPAGCSKFELDKNHSINLDSIVGGQAKVNDECIVYNAFELKEEKYLGFGAGADWWMEVCLNGEKIFSTFPDGNGSYPCAVNNHSFGGKGKKGKNLLAIRVRRGNAGWTFCMTGKNPAIAHPSMPITITADSNRILRKIKPMNGVNNAPISDHGRSNIPQWKAAAIPYSRNHDAAYSAAYGGEHTVDVHAIFPDFSKDPTDPASYHFTETDRYLKGILEVGTKVLYRLGSKIEHQPEKYGTKVPTDFRKWAVICEHIIRHYNEGWADGFKMGIEYWEIWAEPDDLRPVNSTWQGTPEQFFEFFRVAATHLKKSFPKLKIGGPALGGNMVWMKRFLAALTEKGKPVVPLDFFSWHIYTTSPVIALQKGIWVRQMLDEFGYRETESILDEWNYVSGWRGEQYTSSFETIRTLKGAVFAGTMMCIGQNGPMDKLMYYDARPSAFNGIFDRDTFAPLKTYYTFLAWAKLAELGNQIEVDTQDKNGIYAVGASDGKKIRVLFCRYFPSDPLPEDLFITFTLKNGDLRGTRLFLVDQNHNLEETFYRMDKDGNLIFPMKANTLVLLEKE